MRYIITGKGGQGVLFLAKVIALTLLLSRIENFNFLKEFDEGQRNGEIMVTFSLPFKLADKKIVIKEHNMIELGKIIKDLDLAEDQVKQALKIVKPESYEKNLTIWKQGIR